MTSKIGIFSIVAGLVMWLFAMLSKFMDAAPTFTTMTVSTFLKGITDTILDWISNDWLYNMLYSLFYEMHLSGVLVGAGVILLIVGSFFQKD